jgi:hypothetical protein
MANPEEDKKKEGNVVGNGGDTTDTTNTTNSTNIPDPFGGIEDVKPDMSSLSNMLAERRKELKKEKTSAQNMQKYHALTDAFNSLGKMVAIPIGGAVGGNVWDSAPNLGEYKESRGYLDAIEKAKKAKDRLRDLDNLDYQLALSENERTYQQQVNALNRKWQKQLADYNFAIKRAADKEDFAEKERLEKELLQKNQDFRIKLAKMNSDDAMKLQESKNKAAIEEAKVRQQTAIINNMGNDGKDLVKRRMNDGSEIEVSKKDFIALKEYFKGRGMLDDDEVEQFIYENPQLVKDFFAANQLMHPTATQANVAPQTMQGYKINGVGQLPYYQYASNLIDNQQGNYVEAEDSNTGFDLSGYKRKTK